MIAMKTAVSVLGISIGRNRAGVMALLGACLLVGPVFGQQLIDPDPLGLIQNETSLTLIPGGAPGVPALLAVAYNNDPTNPAGLGFGESIDGGITWVTYPLPLPLDPGGSGLLMTDAFDPAAAVDTQGNVFAAHISTLNGYPGASGLFVHRYDWALSGLWFAPVPVAYSPPAGGNPDPFYRFNDKCHIAVDLNVIGLSQYQDNVYAAWIQDGGYNIGAFSDIFFATSVTQGATWTYPGGSPVPVPINDNPYVPLGPPSDMANGPNVAVAPDGTVYVAWMDIDVTQPQAIGTLLIDSSPDGGFTWGVDQVIQPGVLGCPGNLSTGGGAADARARSYPAMAVSPLLNPLGFYDVYVVYPADPDGAAPDEADVFFTSSPDGGLTWSPPLRINTDGTVNDQFQPWIAAKPNGWIDVAWYDRQRDPLDNLWDVVIVRSIDGGLTFTPEVFLTDASISFPTPQMPWMEGWMGEYLGLEVDHDWAYVAFTSSVSDILGDVYFTSIPNLEINTAVPMVPERRTGLQLLPNRPNPFREQTLFTFYLPRPEHARLAIYDVQGRAIRTLVDEARPAGEHAASWDGMNDSGKAVASGAYFCRLEAGEKVLSRKVLLRQ